MAEFLRKFDFVRMRPAREVVKVGKPDEIGFQALAEAGQQYAVYLRRAKHVTLKLDLPQGRYAGEWLDAVSGQHVELPNLEHPGGRTEFKAPELPRDGAFRLVRMSSK
jgi:hypothetical protein